MASSGDEYLIARRKKMEQRRRIVTWVSILSFAGSGLAAVVPALQQAIQSPTPQVESSKPSLKQVAQGFELVLQREPENMTALEGLFKVSLQMNDVQGAIPPLEKIVKLHPERQEYKALLEQLKTQVRQGKQQNNNRQKPN